MFQREGLMDVIVYSPNQRKMCFEINNIIYNMFTTLEMLTKRETRDLEKHHGLINIAAAFVINNINCSML